MNPYLRATLLALALFLFAAIVSCLQPSTSSMPHPAAVAKVAAADNADNTRNDDDVRFADFQLSQVVTSSLETDWQGGMTPAFSNLILLDVQVVSTHPLVLLQPANPPEEFMNSLEEVSDGTGKKLDSPCTFLRNAHPRSLAPHNGIFPLMNYSLRGLMDPDPQHRSLSRASAEFFFFLGDARANSNTLLRLAPDQLGQPVALAEHLSLIPLAITENSLTVELRPFLRSYEKFLSFALCAPDGSVIAPLTPQTQLSGRYDAKILLTSPATLPADARLRVTCPANLKIHHLPLRYARQAPVASLPVESAGATLLQPIASQEWPECPLVPFTVKLSDNWYSTDAGSAWSCRVVQKTDLVLRLNGQPPAGLYFAPGEQSRTEAVVITKAADNTGRDLLVPLPPQDQPRLRLTAEEGDPYGEIRVQLALPAAGASSLNLEGQCSLLGLPGTKIVEFSLADLQEGKQLPLTDNHSLRIVRRHGDHLELATDLPPACNARLEWRAPDGKPLAGAALAAQTTQDCPPGGQKLAVLYQTVNRKIHLRFLSLPLPPSRSQEGRGNVDAVPFEVDDTPAGE